MELFCPEQPGSAQADALVDSYPDPALLRDDRVLTNMLQMEDYYVPSNNMNYFRVVQTELKPYMRKIVATWMWEVGSSTKLRFYQIGFLSEFF